MCMLTDCDVSCKQRAVDGLSAEQDQFTSQRERFALAVLAQRLSSQSRLQLAHMVLVSRNIKSLR